jgi:uncharacterized protein YndB with AHSA1/START domain
MKLNNDLISLKSILINSSPEKVWDVLTNPTIISEYLYGAETITDWKVGSQISFVIKFDEQTFVDKGIVVENNQNELLEYKYWSGFCGLEDRPENYSIVTYKLQKMDNITIQFTWQQKGFADEESRQNSENGLLSILEQIKLHSEK